MAFANFFDRTSQALTQALRVADPQFLSELLIAAPVGIAFADEALDLPNSNIILELATNLFARLYPKLAILQSGTSDKGAALRRRLAMLAQTINPDIELLEPHDSLRAALCVGKIDPPAGTCVSAQADSWNIEVAVGQRPSLLDGSVGNPIAAAAAACFGVGEVFRHIFKEILAPQPIERAYTLSLLDYTHTPTPSTEFPAVRLNDLTIVGVGAVGNALVWTLSRLPELSGHVHIVDHESVDLSNLQRYVLSDQKEVERPKAALATGLLNRAGLAVHPFSQRFGEYVRDHRPECLFDIIAISVDNIPDRIAAQAVLPRVILNGWTSIEAAGHLGVSRHWFDGPHACLACLYLRTGKRPSDTEQIAAATGLPNELVANMVVNGTPLTREHLEAIAASKKCPLDMLLKWETRCLPDFYTEAVCGGAFLQYTVGSEKQEVFVPLAHQSALAGILLTAEVVKAAVGWTTKEDLPEIRLNALMPPSEYIQAPRKKTQGPRCICGDEDFLAVYRQKYHLQRP